MSSNVALPFYDWQKEIINHEGDITIKGGRQTGKSEAVAERIYRTALAYPDKRSLIIAASERQENYIYETVRRKIGRNYKGRSTLSKTVLLNGHEIYKFPVGVSGIYLEGLSNVSFLYADEAIYIGEKVWDSILPMLAKPKADGFGWITLLSSTRGRPKGFFFESFSRKDFKKIHIRSEDCPHLSKEFLDSEKKRLGERMYEVIYGGEFDEEAINYFPSDFIERAKIKGFSKKDINPKGEYYLGIDPAKFGKSKAAFAEAEAASKVRLVYGEELNKSSFQEMRAKTKELQLLFKNRKILFDSGGLGQGFDEFLEEDVLLKRKLFPINNSSRGKDFKILKEDIYSNVLKLLSSEELEVVDQKELIEGLKAVTFEGVEGEEIICGTDMSEACCRAIWGATKQRNKKIKVLTF